MLLFALTPHNRIRRKTIWAVLRRWHLTPWSFLVPPCFSGDGPFSALFFSPIFLRPITLVRRLGLLFTLFFLGSRSRTLPLWSLLVARHWSFWIKEDRAKFQSRCALLLFVHYATSHPLYTYAFYSSRTKRILYRQDAIVLVTTFPMRHARLASGLPSSGESFVPVRSPLAAGLSPDHEFSFLHWQHGDALPPYVDDVTGVPLHDSPHCPRVATPPADLSIPRRYPYHPAFGPRPTVAVPFPPDFPSGSLAPSLLHDTAGFPPDPDPNLILPIDAPSVSTGDSSRHVAFDPTSFASSSLASTDLPLVSYDTSTHDKDMSRGMGNLLRWPHGIQSPISKRQRPNAIPCPDETPVADPPAFAPLPPLSPSPVHQLPSIDLFVHVVLPLLALPACPAMLPVSPLKSAFP